MAVVVVLILLLLLGASAVLLQGNAYFSTARVFPARRDDESADWGREGGIGIDLIRLGQILLYQEIGIFISNTKLTI